jgi:uncharacterized LabA/DUF88 family protein
MRIHAYVDGFNLYHRSLKQRPDLKWLNVEAFVKRFVKPDDEIVGIRYYTSRVSVRTDHGQTERQERYVRAIAALPSVTIHWGNFSAKPACRPLVNPVPLIHPEGRQFVLVHNTQEKGSDVNLSSHLLRDGFRGDYDAAVVVSSDTDLVEPLRIVKEEMRKLTILLYADMERGSVPKKLARACNYIRFASPSDFAKSQLPNPSMTRNGQRVHRPTEWA